MCRCLCCYRPLQPGQVDFHPECAEQFFGTTEVPELNYSRENIDQLAAQIIADKTTLTGVQPKLSLHVTEHEGSRRLTIVGLWGGYILKPQTDRYPQLPEVEDLTMHLAELCGLKTVPHTLMRMADGSLCYLTRRIDRTESGEKRAMEDLCQLTNRQTEHKYRCSYELAGKTLMRYSSMPRMDATEYLNVLLFCYLTGNNDMHLKNFSLYEQEPDIFRLAPAYDLLNVAIVNPADKEEMALLLNEKRKGINRQDFHALAERLDIASVVVDHLLQHYRRLLPEMEKLIGESLLDEDLQTKYSDLLHQRFALIS